MAKPGWQRAHCALWAAAAKLPGAQGAQAAAPPAEAEPGPQSAQVPCAAPGPLPGGQGVQVLLPAVELVPTGQVCNDRGRNTEKKPFEREAKNHKNRGWAGIGAVARARAAM